MIKKTDRLPVREPMSDEKLLMTITIVIFTVLYVFAMLIWGGGFLRVQKLFDLLNDNAYLIILACGMTIVMIGGGIDISVGGVAALTVMCCIVNTNNGGSVLSAALLAVGIGAAFGVCQGFLVSVLRIQPFVVTLAGMFLARGLITVVSSTPQKIVNAGLQTLMNERISINCLGYTAKNGNLIPARIEYGVIIALIVTAAVLFMLSKTRFGRGVYAVGGNRESAMLLGINTRGTCFAIYVISGIIAGVAGFVFMMHTGSGNATNATGSELSAIAAAIIGGTLLSGGVGNVIGTFFGVMTLAVLKSIIVTSGLKEPWWQSITTGAMLCLFIILQSAVLAARGRKIANSASGLDSRPALS